jgi:3',5'-cyclic AMP phosphodiesterase CpdA
LKTTPLGLPAGATVGALCLLLSLTGLGGGAEPGADAAPDPFFFIQLSDPQFGMFTDNADFAQETANFERAVTIINRLRPAFVVVTGDLVNRAGDAAQIAEYRRILARVDPAIPVHNVAGNHDIGNIPTPSSIAAYTNLFGPDHYAFRHQGFVGIVLNSTLIQSPQEAGELLAQQERWLRTGLDQARAAGATSIVVFQHHPWFLSAADEADQYFNIPRARRAAYLEWFRAAGVRYLFCGHYHRNALAHDGRLEVVTTGPVGKPLGPDKSGLRIVIVRGDGLEHRYYALEEAPLRVDLGRPPQSVSRPASRRTLEPAL